MTLVIQVLTWVRHEHVVVLNLLIWSQPSPKMIHFTNDFDINSYIYVVLIDFIYMLKDAYVYYFMY